MASKSALKRRNSSSRAGLHAPTLKRSTISYRATIRASPRISTATVCSWRATSLSSIIPANARPALSSPISRTRRRTPPWRTNASALGCDHPELPRQRHLADDHRIGPSGPLATHVPPGGIDPGLARPRAGVDQQVETGDRHLRILDAADNEERRGGLAEQAEGAQRHPRQEIVELIQRCLAIDREVGGRAVEQIFARVHRGAEIVGLEICVHRRRLRDHAKQARAFGVRELGGPVAAETLTVHEQARLVDFRPGGEIIDEA